LLAGGLPAPSPISQLIFPAASVLQHVVNITVAIGMIDPGVVVLEEELPEGTFSSFGFVSDAAATTVAVDGIVVALTSPLMWDGSSGIVVQLAGQLLHPSERRPVDSSVPSSLRDMALSLQASAQFRNRTVLRVSGPHDDDDASMDAASGRRRALNAGVAAVAVLRATVAVKFELSSKWMLSVSPPVANLPNASSAVYSILIFSDPSAANSSVVATAAPGANLSVSVLSPSAISMNQINPARVTELGGEVIIRGLNFINTSSIVVRWMIAKQDGSAAQYTRYVLSFVVVDTSSAVTMLAC
jgi:hypothetical protein